MKKSMIVSVVAWTLAGITLGAVEPAPVAGDTTSPSFRGSNGSGLYRGVGRTSWSEKDKKGILWQAKLELPGWASPVVWNDKVVVTSASVEKRLVYCFDAGKGTQLWKQEVPEVKGATKEYTLDTQSSEWNDLLHAGATPATDGKRVYAVFSNGQLAALDLATGSNQWSVALGDTSDNKYGVDSSLLVSGDLVIVSFEGSGSFIAAYDAATGKEQWKTKRTSATWASPILVKTKSGASLVVVFADPDVTAWDAKTGAQVWSKKVLTESPEYCVGPSPVTDGERIYVVCKGSGMFALDAEKGDVKWSLTSLPDESAFSDEQSMTTDGQRLYHFVQSVLTVVDAKAGNVLGQPDMGSSSSPASPMVVGDNLYLVCGDTTVVAKTGDKPEKVGEGTLNETINASPAYAGGRVFLRAGTVLYCIGP
jgi:outer membrane protein assembly factor BamB